MTSNATYSRTITVDAPDFASKAVSFSLLTSVAIDAANNEVFPRKEYSLTLDGSGTGSIALPCPDNSGSAAWAWRVSLPDGRDVTTTLAYAGTSLDLSNWLTAATTSETADAITALIESKADKVSGATADNLAGLDANGNLQDSGYGVIDEDSMATDSATDVPTQQSVKAYVDAQIGTVDDVTELTTTTGDSTNMLRVAAAGGLEYRTTAQVLSDIGAAAASHTHGAGDIASGTLVHERGGLEADVSAYSGLVKISGGSTSAVTVTAFGESLIDDADAATARTTLGLGTMATEATTGYLAATGATTGATSSAQDFTNGLTVAGGSNGISAAGVVTGARGIFGAAGTVLIGSGAASVATGSNWVAIGANAGGANTTGSNWVAIGSSAGDANTTGSGWTAIGNLAGSASTTGSGWTAIGNLAGTANTTGSTWTAIGRYAGTTSTTGSSWTAIGYAAGYASTTGTGWTAIGYTAGYANTTSSSWTAIGNNAGRYINSGGNAATNTTFVAIGDDARFSADGTSNEIVIGYQSRGNGSNTTTIGNSSTTHFYGLGIHVLPSGGAPASAAATGTAGSIVWDADYIYICTATDTWKRAAISTWA